MSNNKLRLALFALDSISNVGDEILGDTTRYLLRNYSDQIDVERCQLHPSWKTVSFVHVILACIAMPVKKISSCFQGNVQYKLLFVYFWIRYNFYYRNCVKKANVIMFSVGMFKYSTQDFANIYYLIIKNAQRYNKNVFISAASVQAYNSGDWRSCLLKKAFQMDCLRFFTTRDGENGLKLLKNDYDCTNKIVDYVGDPALWIPECYNVGYKKVVNRDAPFIGVNVIREGIFESYDGNITKDDLFQFYVNLICELESRKCNWTLFSNGMHADNEVAYKLINQLNLNQSKFIPCPSTASDYVKMVKEFDVVIGARLHSCITSFAIGVPITGYIWDNKLDCFSESMGVRHLFVNEKELNAKKIISNMEKALQFTVDISNRNRYKEKTSYYINQFINYSLEHSAND